MTDSTGLTGDTTTFNGDVQIQFTNHVNQFQRLANDHASSLAAEVLFQSTLVDDDVTAARFDEYASGGAFAATSAVVLIFSHCL
jgi:hypothetical protein